MTSPPASDRSSYRVNVVAAFTASAALALTVACLLPAHVYQSNRASVIVCLSDVLTLGTAIAFIGALLLGGLLTLAPRRLQVRLTAAVFAAAVLVLVQGYWLLWSYDVLDGSAIDWAAVAWRGYADGALWIVGLGLALWLAPRLEARIPLLSAAVLLIQVGSLAVHEYQTHDELLDFGKRYYVEKQSALEFSQGRNVIVLVLDEFQSDIFAEAVLPREEYRRPFAGFTYYPDTLAGSNFTELAIPAMLTGRIYSNRRPRMDFLRDVYLPNSLPVALKRAGWTVELYPWRGLANEAIYYHESMASNFRRRPQPLRDRVVDYSRLTDLGLFRGTPHFVKRWVYNESNWQLSQLARRLPLRESGPANEPVELFHTLDNFLAHFAAGQPISDLQFSVRPGADTFKFYHLAGLHVPVKMRRDFTMGTFEYNRANFAEQAEAYARIVGSFLDELRRIGVYDQSMIIIAGDHGSGRTKELHVNPGDPTRIAELDRTAVRNDFERDKARGLPLLLVKPFGAQGELRTSRVSASLVDIPATVRSAVGLPPFIQPAVRNITDFHGESLFALQEGQPRRRYYGAMRWAAEKTPYVSMLALYRVDGDSWFDDSWTYLNTVNPPVASR